VGTVCAVAPFADVLGAVLPPSVPFAPPPTSIVEPGGTLGSESGLSTSVETMPKPARKKAGASATTVQRERSPLIDRLPRRPASLGGRLGSSLARL
jgi:hypothetical protein